MILLTKGICESNINNKKGLDFFGYAITKTGKYFCDKNSLNTHPNIFVGENPLKFIEVTKADLPDEPEV